MAHELGHNFGIKHDWDIKNCKCKTKHCIMGSGGWTQWSNCSASQATSFIEQGLNCLKKVPKYLFNSPTCGNRFLETGEECDCGLPIASNNKCCDPNTCKLRSNATCAMGKCCDMETCQPREEGFECRSSAGECDLPEYCDGKSEFCKQDYYKRNYEVCPGVKDFCFNGTCTNELRLKGQVEVCQNDCNKHGVCNNAGNCHCDKGFAPPNCDVPGEGGSLDSHRVILFNIRSIKRNTFS